MNADLLKDAILKCLAERRARDEFSHGDDATTVEEMEASILEVLRDAGFKNLEFELKDKTLDAMHEIYPSMFEDEEELKP